MSELMVTLCLLGFVIGGALFIFWPDILSLFKRKPKAGKVKQDSVDEIYLRHYTEEDAFLRAANWKKWDEYIKPKSFIEAKGLIDRRGHLIKEMIRDNKPSSHNCPICHGQNGRNAYYQIYSRCRCTDFKKKPEEIAHEAGQDISW